jgi:hypothetical protein
MLFTNKCVIKVFFYIINNKPVVKLYSLMKHEIFSVLNLRNKSWKPECVGIFNMDWQILVFYPEPEARDKIY